MTGDMVDSWKLATISMWLDRLEKEGALKLICDKFNWDELWEPAAELNQLCAARQMARQIPRNKDQGDLKDRVAILGIAVLGSLQELKNRTDNPVYIVTSSNLFQVPGVIKDRVQAEPAVTARLDNIERMVETLTKGFKEMKDTKSAQWPALQVNGAAAPVQPRESFAEQSLGARSRHGAAGRSKSPSVKRSAQEAQLQETAPVQQLGEEPWNHVVNRNQGRRPRSRPVQYGTAKVNVAGGEAAPYDIVVGNTNPASTDEIIKDVLQKVAQGMPEDLKLEKSLEILEVECLTKPRLDGRRIWTRTWRVQVPNMFKEHMMRPEAYPAGWTSRRYFPPRAQRPPVPDLDPTVTQPPEKRANVNGQANLQN